MKIKEVNTGIYIVKAEILQKYLPRIKNENSKGEFYLTDLVSLAIEDEKKVQSVEVKNKMVAHGVNNQEELAEATKIVYQAKAKQLMSEGVIFIDPAASYVEESVTVGAGTVIYPGAF